MAVRKLEEAQKSIKKLNAQLLRVEQKLDERSQTIYHNRLEQRSKAKHLKKIIHVRPVLVHTVKSVKRLLREVIGNH